MRNLAESGAEKRGGEGDWETAGRWAERQNEKQ